MRMREEYFSKLQAQSPKLLLVILLILSNTHVIATTQAETVSTVDIDGDGLSDKTEDPNGNGVFDPGETDWRNADTDRGGEADGSEIAGGRSPLVQFDDMTYDRDGDGYTNGQEFFLGTDPTRPDTDGDGINDRLDPFPLEKAFTKDADGDRIADEWEVTNRLSPTNKEDAALDTDGDGLTNLQEFTENTNPNVTDTDRDGVEDADELAEGTDPEESACLAFGEQSVTFPDMEGHWAAADVRTLSQTLVMPSMQPIVKGYKNTDGTASFLPNRLISRFELLKIALFSSCVNMRQAWENDAPVTFNDVPRTSRPRESEDHAFIRRIIYTAAAIGVVRGYNDGAFRPDQPVTRAEALKILLLASRLEQAEEEVSLPFPDVAPDAWYTSYVSQAFSFDIIRGYDDGTFRPDDPITRAEAAKIVHNIIISNPNVNGYVIPHE